MKPLLVLALLFAAAGTAAATPTLPCTYANGTGRIVTYWSDTIGYNPLRSSSDARCNKSGGVQTCLMRGVVVRPFGITGTAPRGTILFLHGSGNPMPAYCATIDALVGAGYIVFEPTMRGIQLAPTMTANTGVDIVTWAAAQSAADPQHRSQVFWTFRGYEDADLDVDSALRFIATEPNVSIAKLAMVGHSYGGGQVAVSATHAHTGVLPHVAASLSGAGMSWTPTNEWQPQLHDYAGRHLMPMYYDRVINESQLGTIDSGLDQYVAATQSGTGGARFAAYSAYTARRPTPCDDIWWHTAHCAFRFEPEGIDIWIDGLLAFLADYGVS